MPLGGWVCVAASASRVQVWDRMYGRTMVSFEFTAEVFRWKPDAAWHFVTVPEDVTDAIRSLPIPPKGFGSVRVRVELGRSTWDTSLFPDSGSGCYILPIKKAVREAESLAHGDGASVTVTVRDV